MEARRCRLIINADDFGLSDGVNAAVVELHDTGILPSASLMIGAPAAEKALHLAGERPSLAVGLHVTLVHGVPILPRHRVSRLVDREGRLPRDYARAGMRYTLLPAHRSQWQAEMEAQFAAFAASGLSWSHVDSHVHFSLTPAVFRDLLPLLRQYRVPGFRIPQDDFALYRRLEPADTARQRLLAAWFDFQCRTQRRSLVKSGLRVTERCYGLFRSERLDEAYLVRLVESLPDGDFELHCHPRLDTEAGRVEVQALQSAGFREALRRRRVELTTYTGLGPQT